MLLCNTSCYITGGLQARKSFYYKALRQLTAMTRNRPFKNPFKTRTVKDPNNVTTNTITHQYDLLGRLYKVTDNSGTTKNTYDKAGRLIRVEYPGSKTVADQYDAASNRTRLSRLLSSCSYDL